MFEQTFKNIDDILHKDAGCGSELDYVEQTSWVLFLKYLDDLENDKATAAELTGKQYKPLIDTEYQWNVWAAPKLVEASKGTIVTVPDVLIGVTTLNTVLSLFITILLEEEVTFVPVFEPKVTFVPKNNPV